MIPAFNFKGLFGKLHLYEIILRYDYPRIFVCKDVFDNKYLFYEIEFDETWNEWIVAKLPDKIHSQLIKGEISIRKCLLERKNHYIIKYDFKQKDFLSFFTTDIEELITKNDTYVNSSTLEIKDINYDDEENKIK